MASPEHMYIREHLLDSDIIEEVITSIKSDVTGEEP